VLNIVAGCGAYSFLDGYSKYHQISIVLKDRYKTTFVTEWAAFIWKVMLFGVKNGISKSCDQNIQRVFAWFYEDISG
jgi:hypothetical protein